MNFIKYLWQNHKVTFFVLAAMFLVPFGLLFSISWKVGLGFIAICGLTYLVGKFFFFVTDCYEDYLFDRHFWK